MFPTDFETNFTMENQSDSTDKNMPFRILLLGDWSGRESRPDSIEPPKFKSLEIDRDNLEEVMQKLSVKLVLSFDQNDKNDLLLEFSELDDFHPDRIFQRLSLFSNLSNIRKKLSNSDTFNEAAREVNLWITDDEPDKTDVVESTHMPADIGSSDNLLDQILLNDDKKDDSLRPQIAQKTELSEFVNHLVKPYVIQTDLSEQSKLLLIVDEVVSDLMRKILHHPQFRALESAWRGLNFLVRRAETDSNLKIYLMDITKSELSENLKSSDDLSDTAFFRTVESGIVGNYADNEPWTIIGGNYSFSMDVDDTALLLRNAKIAKNLNAPFLSHIRLNFVKVLGDNSLQDSKNQKILDDSNEGRLWEMLRLSDEADYLGLLSPRFLARLPYGEQSDPTEYFAFEESSDFESPENYLWANPIFACVLMLAQTFAQFEWDITTNFDPEINNLPVLFYEKENEKINVPCTEIPFNEKICERLLNEGIMSLVSFRSSDKIRLARLQSIANPTSTLSGKWN